jgi:hypothetical protein
MSISAIEFMRRFLLHILPTGLHRIRHFGLFASKGKVKRINLCKRLANTLISDAPRLRSPVEIIQAIFGKDVFRCPACFVGHLSRASP